VTNYYNDHHCTGLIRHCKWCVLITLGVWPLVFRHGRHNCYVIHVFPTIVHTALLESMPVATQQHEYRSRVVSTKQRMCIPIPLQAWTGPGCSRRLRFSDFKKIGTWCW